MTGDLASAAKHLEAELAREGGASVDVHLLLAEALWQQGGASGTDKALPHYEAAAALAHAAGDAMKEGMIALGHGFALSKLGRIAEARERLQCAKSLAEADGNKQAAQFAASLLQQVESQADENEAAGESMRALWRQFAEAISVGKPAVLFLRGSFSKPADDTSFRGVSRLREAGCQDIEFISVDSPGNGVPEGLQSVADSVHLQFPQLFVAGAALDGWLELAVEQLREHLKAAGLALGEPGAKEPCHGTAAFSEGLEPWEVALTEMVSKDGDGKWAEKAAELAKRGLGDAFDAKAIEDAWQRLAPIIKEKLETQPEMPCGHSCNTCPTRHDCQLHDAVGGAKDIEDLA